MKTFKEKFKFMMLIKLNNFKKTKNKIKDNKHLKMC